MFSFYSFIKQAAKEQEAVPAAKADNSAMDPQISQQQRRLKKGDNAWSIYSGQKKQGRVPSRNGKTVGWDQWLKAFASHNNLKDPNKLKQGQSVRVPSVHMFPGAK